MTKEEVELGLKCCEKYYCGGCPYQIYDNDPRYPIRCIHKMIQDVLEILF